MARTIIDITELANWEGKLTGVPRVMNELSTRFAEDDTCVFVVWNAFEKQYQIIDLPSTRGSDNPPSPEVHQPNSSIRKYARAAAVTRKLKGKSRLVSKALVVPEKLARKLLVAEPKTKPVQLASPKKSDVLFVLADWHGSDQAFVDYLINLKESGVGLAHMSYDLLPIVTPQYSGHATKSLTNYTKSIYPLCDVIFAISEHTKQDIIKWLKHNRLNVPSIEVIRLGDDFKLAKPQEPTDVQFIKSRKAGQGFILCVGTIEARKNHTLLYYVYKLARQRNITLPDLVVVGRPGWKSEDMYEIMTTDPETKEAFIFLQTATDEELSWLYKNALFSVYPSFYEGWGLPIAESIAHGVPCVCSNTSSMPEIAGDLIPYFSPFSTDECLGAITNMLKPGAISQAKRKIEAYRPVPWDQPFGFIKKLIGEVHAKNN